MALEQGDAGGSTHILRPGLGPALGGIFGWFREAKNRPDEKKMGFAVVGVDKQYRPPNWVETKDVDMLGRKIEGDMRGSTHWEVKYERELAIGDLRFAQKLEEDTMEKHDIIGTWRTILRKFDMWPEELNSEQMQERATREFEARQRAVQEKEEKKKLDWQAFVGALESDKPLLTVAGEYRNVYDCFGIDDFLDSTTAVLWLAFKVGAFIGIGQGGVRALKTLHVDAPFLKASGIGALTFANVSILTGLMKWAGNITVAGAMFLAGDRAVTACKAWTLPDEVRPQRSPVNYSAGLALSFGVAGVLPWWILNDALMGARLGVSGLVLGGGLGYSVGLGIHHLVSLNMSRLEYTPAQFRMYQALMKRERQHVENEIERLRSQQGLAGERQVPTFKLNGS